MRQIYYSIAFALVASGCKPDIVNEVNYCGWVVLNENYDANLWSDCYWMTVQSGEEEREIYVGDNVAMKYSIGDTICHPSR